MTKIRAREYLETHGDLEPDDVYDLTLLATGSEEQAAEAMRKCVWDRLASGQTV